MSGSMTQETAFTVCQASVTELPCLMVVGSAVKRVIWGGAVGASIPVICMVMDAPGSPTKKTINPLAAFKAMSVSKTNSSPSKKSRKKTKAPFSTKNPCWIFS